jgi:hypothetical protein
MAANATLFDMLYLPIFSITAPVVLTKTQDCVLLCHSYSIDSYMLYEWIEYLWPSYVVEWGRHWGAAVNGRPVSARSPRGAIMVSGRAELSRGTRRMAETSALRAKLQQEWLYKWVWNHLFVSLYAHVVNLLFENINNLLYCKQNAEIL